MGEVACVEVPAAGMPAKERKAHVAVAEVLAEAGASRHPRQGSSCEQRLPSKRALDPLPRLSLGSGFTHKPIPLAILLPATTVCVLIVWRAWQNAQAHATGGMMVLIALRAWQNAQAHTFGDVQVQCWRGGRRQCFAERHTESTSVADKPAAPSGQASCSSACRRPAEFPSGQPANTQPSVHQKNSMHKSLLHDILIVMK